MAAQPRDLITRSRSHLRVRAELARYFADNAPIVDLSEEVRGLVPLKASADLDRTLSGLQAGFLNTDRTAHRGEKVQESIQGLMKG